MYSLPVCRDGLFTDIVNYDYQVKQISIFTVVKSSSSGHRLLYLYISHLAKAFIRHSKCFCHLVTYSSSSILSKKSSLSSISISRISGKVQSSRLPLYGQSLKTFSSLSSRSLVVIRNRVSQLVFSYQYLGYKQFCRHCDICKDFRLEIPALHSRCTKPLRGSFLV